MYRYIHACVVTFTGYKVLLESSKRNIFFHFTTEREASDSRYRAKYESLSFSVSFFSVNTEPVIFKLTRLNSWSPALKEGYILVPSLLPTTTYSVLPSFICKPTFLHNIILGRSPLLFPGPTVIVLALPLHVEF